MHHANDGLPALTVSGFEKVKIMFCVYDTFNNKIVSRHRTVVAAVKANRKFQNAIERNNGRGSYIPTELREIVDGEAVKVDEDSNEMSTWLYHPANVA